MLHHNLRLACTYVATNSLQPPARALRKTSKRQMVALKASLTNFGFTRPLLIDQEGRIIAGHNVWLAAKAHRLAEVPVVQIDHLSPEQIQLYQLMDNRSAELSVWDDDLLHDAVRELTDLDLSGVAELNLELSGFSSAEFDRILDVRGVEQGNSEGAPSVESVAITALGDLYDLGDQHRLICGNALEAQTYTALLGEEKAQLVVTDPPYGVAINGHVSGLGKTKHREFVMGGAELEGEKLTEFLATAFGHIAAHSIDGAILFTFIDWRHLRQMLDAGNHVFSELKNLIVWNKHPYAGMGSFYRSQHELCFAWKHGKAPHINNFGLGETGRHRTNVWTCPPANNFQRSQDEFLKAHPTPKPPSLFADAMRDCSKRGGIVLDPFAGSGVTAIAAEMTGRKARLIELDPLYCDVIVRRWQAYTGEAAIHVATGCTFDDLAAERGAASSDEEA
ncbi:hypothetical protein BSL82_08445 [Tardibacter chloracetimidivorans]|uniref:Methyltransferase n=1 Tax=Tardibacter chloracetimidivorans TaxID=1921510 RepID=A0A1L3ZZI5_9SPHN|nr:hypothetical protein BSL82_08445 [Tardibacter chloracetimidivorans]